MGGENSMQKVLTDLHRTPVNSDYKPSAPANYTPPPPVRVPVPSRRDL